MTIWKLRPEQYVRKHRSCWSVADFYGGILLLNIFYITSDDCKTEEALKWPDVSAWTSVRLRRKSKHDGILKSIINLQRRGNKEETRRGTKERKQREEADWNKLQHQCDTNYSEYKWPIRTQLNQTADLNRNKTGQNRINLSQRAGPSMNKMVQTESDNTNQTTRPPTVVQQGHTNLKLDGAGPNRTNQDQTGMN